MSRLSLQGWLILLALTLLSSSGCSRSTSTPTSPTTQTPPASPRLKVVATFLPMYWFTKAVAGDLAKVDVLIPPGVEVHEYQTKPKDVQAIAEADLIVKNGLGLEQFLQDTLKNAQNPQRKEIDASTGIQPLQEVSPVVKTGSEAEEHHDHDHASGNPHVWLDPILAIKQVQNIRDGLIAADPTNKATYEANAANYIQQLQELDRQFKQTLQPYPNCTFITFHDAYPYLAKRYQLQQMAVVEIPEDRLSPGDIAKTIATVKKYKVKALFGEPGVDNKLLSSLSKDLNLTLRTLDSLESGTLEPQHYFTAMKANLQTIESACR